MDMIHQVLDLARWAPSGDNTQPWRFEIQSEDAVLVHGYDTRDHCVYDLDGCASQLAHGALLETIALAATRFGYRTDISLVDDRDARHVVYGVRLRKDETTVTDPLVDFIQTRSVQRRAMRPSRIPAEERRTLAHSVGDHRLILMDSMNDRWRMAMLNTRNAHIRLTIPEAFAVHKAVIAWGCETSEDRMPDASLGAGPILRAMMRSAMTDWNRVQRLNRFAAGTLLPRLALDFLPGLSCSAHFALVAPHEPTNVSERIQSGRAIQRLWLTATQLGFQMQPSYTPLVFARYARENRRFTDSTRARFTASGIAQRLSDILGSADALNTVFLGRLGPARVMRARSLRLPLDRLMLDIPGAKRAFGVERQQ